MREGEGGGGGRGEETEKRGKVPNTFCGEKKREDYEGKGGQHGRERTGHS
jgi:hypothetical protein